MAPESPVAGGERWYDDAQRYWENVPASVDGVLGGFERLNRPDIYGSRLFLNAFLAPNGHRPKRLQNGVACGIGRITKGLLAKLFMQVDLVEQDATFLRHAQEVHLAEEVKQGKTGEFYETGLQSFTPPPGLYDAIWCQWVLSHLPDGMSFQ
ncbi:hypothetical protein IWQ60_000020 [Tieghemiomyces parasiticus]|uniref:Alpha N-terminal protein methyltransferase 1 n=1 Tax=Tieghemiomyces parasiticus TaxID=78921 RepID=A0A9W8ALZ1_9FUNG|nr:hypothetical protein IWQ60_000020 [Tieghemiomyces parasiticus]